MRKLYKKKSFRCFLFNRVEITEHNSNNKTYRQYIILVHCFKFENFISVPTCVNIL